MDFIASFSPNALSKAHEMNSPAKEPLSEARPNLQVKKSLIDEVELPAKKVRTRRLRLPTKKLQESIETCKLIKQGINHDSGPSADLEPDKRYSIWRFESSYLRS